MANCFILPSPPRSRLAGSIRRAKLRVAHFADSYEFPQKKQARRLCKRSAEAALVQETRGGTGQTRIFRAWGKAGEGRPRLAGKERGALRVRQSRAKPSLEDRPFCSVSPQSRRRSGGKSPPGFRARGSAAATRFQASRGVRSARDPDTPGRAGRDSFCAAGLAPSRAPGSQIERPPV